MLARLHRALVQLKTQRRFLPQSLMGKAINYALNQWPSLLLFLEDGRIESERSGDSLPQAARRASVARQLDNNLIENAIRPSAIGNARAGDRSAILYTIIECCRRRGIDPFAYLRDVFTRLPSMTHWQVKDLTPEAWTKSQQPAELRSTA